MHARQPEKQYPPDFRRVLRQPSVWWRAQMIMHNRPGLHGSKARSSACADIARSCGANGIRIATLFRSGREGTRTPENMNAQVSCLGVRRWRYWPPTRTRCKLLTNVMDYRSRCTSRGSDCERQGISRTIDDQDVDLLPAVQDQVDDLPRIAGTEIPATNGTVWVVLMQRRPVPRCQLERAEHIGIGVKRVSGKRSDLVGSVGIDDDSVHLHVLTQPLANQSLHVVTRHTAGQGLAGRQRMRRSG